MGIFKRSLSLALSFYLTASHAQDVKTAQDIVGDVGAINISTLDQKEQQILQGFRDGRYGSGSGKDGTRFQETVEFHDQSVRGLSHHPLSQKIGSTLEKGVDVAAGIPLGTAADKREEMINKSRKCKEDGSKCDISNSVEDVKQAHGPKDDNHRVYQVKKDVIDASKKAGSDFAAKDILAASVNDAAGTNLYTAAGLGKIRDKDTGQIQEVAPNIRKLQDTAAFVIKQQDRNIRDSWRAIRANRLSHAYVNPTNTQQHVDAALGGLVQSGANDQQIGQRIAEMKVAGKEFLCGTMDAPKICKDENGKTDDRITIPDADGKGGSHGISLHEFASRGIDVPKVNQLYNDQLQSLPDEKKKEIEKLAPIASKCLGENIWCDSRDPEFKAVQGDPGGVYSDARELFYLQLSKARRGSVDSFSRVMQNADFNQGNNKRDWNEMQREIANVQRAAQQQRQNDKMGQFAGRSTGNSNTQGIFAVTCQSGGSTLAGECGSPGPSAQAGSAVARGSATANSRPLNLGPPSGLNSARP